MITEISLENFKCFRNKETFTFSKLNLLTGINGHGKSTVLQSMLLLSQTFRKLRSPQHLLINGEWVELSTFIDLKNSHIEKNIISIDLKTDDLEQNDIHFEFSESAKNERIADLTGLVINNIDMFVEMSDNSTTEKKSPAIVETKKSLSPLDSVKTFTLFQKFHFISADRLGPIEYVKKRNTPESSQIGIRGENLINMLAEVGDEFKVINSLCLGQTRNSLNAQTIDWMAYIFDGADIKISGKEKDSSILSMKINSQSDSHLYKPANVGFGYSYVLPLIVTGLIAKPSDVVIIENPEAHLHPRAQTRIAEFFSKVASVGVQVFIESHSEHILNGLRICALNPEIRLTNEDLTIHYFNESYTSEKLIINEKGKITNWPQGFFDQQEIDLAEIFKYSRMQ